MTMTLDEALLKITEMQQQLETEQQISANLKNELNTTIMKYEENPIFKIIRLFNFNLWFF